jgi:tetratricopeptide (TPR) repeat protein
MSVLNTMLRDLERRGVRPALSTQPGEAARIATGAPIQTSPEPHTWRLKARLALLLAAGAAASAAIWLWPRPAPTARYAPASTSAPKPVPAAPQAPAVAPPLQPTPPSQAESAALSAMSATAAPAAAQPMHPHTPTPRFAPAAPATAPQRVAPEPRATAATGAPAVAQSSAQSALARAMELVAHGRISDAVQLLASGLSEQPAWHDARSALAALQAESGDRRQALATLLDGVAFDPVRFAPTAAQLQAELNDPAGALQTLDRVPAASRDRTVHALAAAVAQRAGQHERAIAEYEAALRSAPSDWLAWVGLGVSLQALGRDQQALEAFRNSARGTLSAELRRFVQSRISVLQATAGTTLTPAPLSGGAGH